MKYHHVIEQSVSSCCSLSQHKYRSWMTRKPSCRWQTRATRKHDKNCSNST